MLIQDPKAVEKQLRDFFADAPEGQYTQKEIDKKVQESLNRVHKRNQFLRKNIPQQNPNVPGRKLKTFRGTNEDLAKLSLEKMKEIHNYYVKEHNSSTCVSFTGERVAEELGYRVDQVKNSFHLLNLQGYLGQAQRDLHNGPNYYTLTQKGQEYIKS